MARFERQRLALLTQFADAITTRRLTELGVGPGWRCLDVGAGDGSVARWLAGRVGPRGRVVATDLNPRFLAGHGLPNLEVRRARAPPRGGVQPQDGCDPRRPAGLAGDRRLLRAARVRSARARGAHGG